MNIKDYNIRDTMEGLDEKVEIIYKNQSLLFEYSGIARDYGKGFLMTEVEAHTLGYISKQEGLTATQLSAITLRTKGAVSMLLNKLEQKGLIERRNKGSDKKQRKIYLTAKGKQAVSIHRAYDREKMLIMLNALLQECTMDEVDHFFKVLDCRNRILKKSYKKTV